MKGCNALIIGSAGIVHLGKTMQSVVKHAQTVNKEPEMSTLYLIDDSLDQVKLSLQRGIQQEGQGVELHSEIVASAFRVWLL